MNLSEDHAGSADRRFRAAPGSRNSIFISYRRSDSQDVVGRLADSLRRYFGPDRIYRDLDSNRFAEDYVVQIDDAFIRSRIVLAVLGPTWLTSRSIVRSNVHRIVRWPPANYHRTRRWVFWSPCSG